MSKTGFGKLKVLIMAAGILFLLPGCGTKQPFWGNPDSGFILEYRLGEEDRLTYASEGNVITTLEMMGRSREDTTRFSTEYELSDNTGERERNLRATVTLNDVVVESEGFGENNFLDTSSLTGKKFGVVYTPAGRELEHSGLDSIQIDMGQMQGGKQSISRFFQKIFMELPEKPVKIGDSWSSAIDTVQNQRGIDVHTVVNYNSRLLGYRTVGSYECLEIETESQGEVEGEGESMGQKAVIEGDISGTILWHFAYKRGFLVKMSSEATSEMDIQIGGIGGMSMPMTQKIKNEVVLTEPAI